MDCLKDHPEGQTTDKGDRRDLDFGWFSVPPPGPERLPTGNQRGSGEEMTDSRATPQRDTMDPGQDGLLQAGQETPGIPDQNSRSASRSQGDRAASRSASRIEHTLTHPLAQDTQQTSPDDFNWPLSSVGRAQVPHKPEQPKESHGAPRGRHPNSVACDGPPGRPEVPSTPIPPVSLGGYGEFARPTYRSWREHWHQQHSNSNNNSYSRPTDFETVNPYEEAIPMAHFEGATVDAEDLPPYVEQRLPLPALEDDGFGVDGFRFRSVQYSEQAGRYVPSLVIKWHHEDPEQDDLPATTKGSNLVNSLRSKMAAVLSSLKCWSTVLNYVASSRKVPYNRFDERNDEMKSRSQ